MFSKEYLSFKKMNKLALEQKVKEFVAKQICVKPESLSIQTRLCEDLGIDGADADDLFERFAEEFQVDLSTFQLDKYFGPEAGFNIFLSWLVLSTKLETLTIQDLVCAAQASKWLKS
jgi:acyl carrier protein